MRISTKGRYGLRAMLELARNGEGQPMLMSAIAERQALSRKYLHALLTSLKDAGLIRSVRGTGGGFVLARPADQIKVSEILHALEGDFAVTKCVADEQVCGRTDNCPTRMIWARLTAAIEDLLDGVMLAELAGDSDDTSAARPAKRQKRSRKKTAGAGARRKTTTTRKTSASPPEKMRVASAPRGRLI